MVINDFSLNPHYIFSYININCFTVLIIKKITYFKDLYYDSPISNTYFKLYRFMDGKVNLLPSK